MDILLVYIRSLTERCLGSRSCRSCPGLFPENGECGGRDLGSPSPSLSPKSGKRARVPLEACRQGTTTNADGRTGICCFLCCSHSCVLVFILGPRTWLAHSEFSRSTTRGYRSAFRANASDTSFAESTLPR